MFVQSAANISSTHTWVLKREELSLALIRVRSSIEVVQTPPLSRRTHFKENTAEISIRQLERVRDDQKYRASRTFFPLLAGVCSAGASHVLPFEREPASFEGAGSGALLKWIVMYAWQALIIRLARGCFKEEMLKIRAANPLTLSGTKFFSFCASL